MEINIEEIQSKQLHKPTWVPPVEKGRYSPSQLVGLLFFLIPKTDTNVFDIWKSVIEQIQLYHSSNPNTSLTMRTIATTASSILEERERKNEKTAGGRRLIFTSFRWCPQHLPCILKERFPQGSWPADPVASKQALHPTSPPLSAHRITQSNLAFSTQALAAAPKHFTFMPYSSSATWTSQVSLCPPNRSLHSVVHARPDKRRGD